MRSQEVYNHPQSHTPKHTLVGTPPPRPPTHTPTPTPIGLPLDQCTKLPAATRNALATRMLRLTIRELFEFHTVQTDPNWYAAPYYTRMLRLTIRVCSTLLYAFAAPYYTRMLRLTIRELFQIHTVQTNPNWFRV
jgi:hypothetical protein